jgi:hypothetical protein
VGFVGILKTSAWLVMQAVQLQSNLKIWQQTIILYSNMKKKLFSKIFKLMWHDLDHRTVVLRSADPPVPVVL